ncbi:hypothetical protein COW36_22890 [bacterium (Candidatus Blackallbacteria) CG17_big_fil_post_rev_8_21_14_2_50_48_46]|uniref:Uncharacterized protein n=1 Tax=bacterium (Candidatus Blackallbacteria) CG17_big_fil_post_rev_8_21_14_2_50_48_46 TaxID=2014261 RepID=A0A2M7FY18_9BACT|nr:MAG: hypothetical protein COW64_15960 [bacterium (Candidatus Blackallbacteria) CG18_big_fil_WC_8_21_14_2_50_49_26]PIW14098.1 MAG: hypothetical protein COW36_22890 [bacterium (Candidatus Blackallbacteria) CG17_big_fil_post_rev_8_21_14_2_50_48_46]PIW45828.1 MAG: hypothetical protein COW20_18555 [bacterium (Candidatus Blackallbacteria) CG13_big_fil_rev_8_21_14_2_50_49_14]
MEDYKAPLAETPVSAGDELTLADLERLHGLEAAEAIASAGYESNLEDLQDSTLELSEDLQGSDPDDLELAIEHQRIEIPSMTTAPPAEASETPVESPAPAAQPGLMIQVGSETLDLSKKDDISWFEQEFQALFSQNLYPYLQRMSRTWNSETEVSAMYQKLEELSRNRGPVEEIMDVAQQVSVYREMTEKERLNAEEIQATLTRIETLQGILGHYQGLFSSLR